MLAAKIIQEQGVHVEGINFFTGFCVEGHTHAIRKKDTDKPKRNNALWCAEQLNMKLHIIDVIDEYKDVLLKPEYGYGKNMNPCLDCKIFMVRKAKEWAIENGFDFIITGEVIGQRPMSQRKETMPVVQKKSGINDLLLRPLSAKNLPETLPEREGWVKREELFDFHGRNRKPQMALAEKYGFIDYATPAGGCCFLTDKKYSDKLVDLWKGRGSREYDFDDIMLLKIGRHLRPSDKYKLIISREEGENMFLSGYKNQFVSIKSTSCGGPLTLVDGDATDEDLVHAASIVARYSQGRDQEVMTLQIQQPRGEAYEVEVKPLKEAEIQEKWYV
ncbi:tRNA (5-methylaminomethyl-2-thiouridylate)-methyltransferase [Francisellaceae bacterium]|nr:tRNA (5-methylaminomethyl-2-thiouridylate)-methyltransferase [Francisellaceae bacterium]